MAALSRKYGAIAAWLLCAFSLFSAMRFLGHRQMGAFDDNIVIDTAWRMFIGQKPYVDFYLPLSPEFYLGAGWAFKLWGVNWSALVLLSAVFAVVTFALQSIALSQFLPRRYAIALSLICQMLAMMVTSYWWYNSTASITACLLFSAALALAIKPAAKIPAIIFCVALMMLSVMKVNIAAVSIAAVVLPLLTIRALRNKLIVWIACSALAVLLFLVACHLNPVDIVKAYLRMAGSRGKPSLGNFLRGKPNEAFISLPLIGASMAAFAVLCAQLFRAPRENRPAGFGQVVFIASSGILLGILFIFMSTEQTLISGIPLIFLSLSSLVLWALDRKVAGLQVPSGLVLATVLCAAATAVGVALFDRLPFNMLIGQIRFRAQHKALLMAWSFLMVMGAATFAAGVAGFSPWRSVRGGAARPLTGTRRFLSSLLIVAGFAGASAACWSGGPFVALLGLWSVTAASSVAALIMMARGADARPVRLTDPLTRWPAVLLLLMATTSSAAAYVGERRLRVRGNGVELFYSENPPVAIGRPFFRDFAVSPGLKAAVDRIETVLSDYQSQGYDTSHVFFGVRLEFAYAAFGIPSPTGTPVWWDPDAAYPPRDEPVIVERFIAHRFRICVLYGREPEFTFLPTAIVDELNNHYRRVAYPEITVFLRNPTP